MGTLQPVQPAIVGIPIKPFGVAKQRLSPVLDAKQRSVLGRAVAARTASTIASSGVLPVVVTSDDGVARWAKSLHLEVLRESISREPGLNRAAQAVVVAAGDEPWAIVHADLPLATSDDFDAMWEALEDAPSVIAPSRDGGTNAIAAHGPVHFRYGPGSYIAHRSGLPTSVVLVRPGLAYDLDTPADLDHMRRLAAGGWIRSLLDIVEASPGSW